MAAEDNLSKHQFPYEIRHGSGIVGAFLGERQVGSLSWHDPQPAREVWGGRRNPDGSIESVLIPRPATPEIVRKVVVHPDHRRRGVATAMLDAARMRHPALMHSDNESAEGAAWAKARP